MKSLAASDRGSLLISFLKAIAKKWKHDYSPQTKSVNVRVPRFGTTVCFDNLRTCEIRSIPVSFSIGPIRSEIAKERSGLNGRRRLRLTQRATRSQFFARGSRRRSNPVVTLLYASHSREAIRDYKPLLSQFVDPRAKLQSDSRQGRRWHLAGPRCLEQVQDSQLMRML